MPSAPPWPSFSASSAATTTTTTTIARATAPLVLAAIAAVFDYAVGLSLFALAGIAASIIAVRAPTGATALDTSYHSVTFDSSAVEL